MSNAIDISNNEPGTYFGYFVDGPESQCMSECAKAFDDGRMNYGTKGVAMNTHKRLFNVLSVAIVLICSLIAIHTANILPLRSRKFDSTTWINDKPCGYSSRHRIATYHDVINNVCNNKTRAEMESLLGKPDSRRKKWSLYCVGTVAASQVTLIVKPNGTCDVMIE